MLVDVKSEVRVCAYDWRWYYSEPELDIQKLNIALLTLRQRGVKIFILVDKSTTQNVLRGLDFNVRKVDSSKMLHTKAICIDEKSLIIGSHNLTKRACSANYEMSIITQEFEPVQQFIKYFNAMWASRA
jgi:phosphatidylserine/phosphatidylglycerophosphate/cardiolipin synthase-like enzyme